MLRIEPEWWAEARKLKKQKLTYTEISKIIGRSRRAIRYALDPEEREKCINTSKRKHKLGIAVISKSKRDYTRTNLRAYGREKFRTEGGDLREIYRELGCL